MAKVTMVVLAVAIKLVLAIMLAESCMRMCLHHHQQLCFGLPQLLTVQAWAMVAVRAIATVLTSKRLASVLMQQANLPA